VNAINTSPDSSFQQITLQLLALDDPNDLLKVIRMIFLFPESFCPNKFTKNMPPFQHKFETTKEIEIKVLINLEDGSNHHLTYRPRLEVILLIFSLFHGLDLMRIGISWCGDYLFGESRCRQEIR
jgi:hypothetical protein